jgi:hypothetical protein
MQPNTTNAQLVLTPGWFVAKGAQGLESYTTKGHHHVRSSWATITLVPSQIAQTPICFPQPMGFFPEERPGELLNGLRSFNYVDGPPSKRDKNFSMSLFVPCYQGNRKGGGFARYCADAILSIIGMGFNENGAKDPARPATPPSRASTSAARKTLSWIIAG